MKFLVILITLGMFGAGIYGMTAFDSTEGFSLAEAYPKDSFGEAYTIKDQELFGEVPTEVYFVLNQVNFNSPETEPIILELIGNLTSSSYLVGDSLSNWYTEYLSFKQEGEFYNDLDLFLQSPQGLKFNADIIRDQSGIIAVSKFNGLLNPTTCGSRFTDLDLQLEAKEELDNLTEKEGIDSFAYTSDWVLFSSYPKIKSVIYESFIVAILTLMGMLAIFIPPSFLVAVFVSTIFTTVNTIGFFSLVGLGINSYTGYWVLVAWGISAEYTINYVYDFSSIPDSDNEYRAERALSLGSSSMLPTVFVTALGVIPLVFGQNPLTYTFAYGIWTVLFFSAWHSWFFMPVMHSLLGTRSINSYSFDKLPCV